MKQKEFYTARGLLTRYALACGYKTAWGGKTLEQISSNGALRVIDNRTNEVLYLGPSLKDARNVLYEKNKNTAYFVGIDRFNRPVFRHPATKQYYCLCDKLYSYGATPTQEEIDTAIKREGVTVKGKYFENEPCHGVTGIKLSASPY